MAALGSGDMRKTASAGPYAGKSRSDIFQLKIKDKKDFVLGVSSTGVKVVGVTYDVTRKLFSYYLKGDRDKTIKQVAYTKVFKDSDFGGGAGSGGGASDTAYTESLQCFYCAYVFNVAKKPVTFVTNDQLNKTERFAYTDKSLKECLIKGPSDWIETDVYIKTANKLWSKFGPRTSGAVYFHRGSTFMNDLYKTKNQTHAIDRKSDSPQAPGSFSNDKWNPGDIWMTTLPSNSRPLIDNADSWGELNERVSFLAGTKSSSDKTKLLGISLKKIGKDSRATLTEYKNLDNTSVTKQKYTYRGYKYGRRGDFFSSQDIYIETNASEIQFRTFGGSDQWQGEIKGASAAAGKIGGGNVDFYAKKHLVSGFLPAGGESVLFAETRRSDYPEKLYKLYSDHNSGQLIQKPLMTYDEFLSEFEKTSINWKNSKIVCMKFLEVLEKSSKIKQDDFINLLYLYGSSDTDQSSYFVKIS